MPQGARQEEGSVYVSSIVYKYAETQFDLLDPKVGSHLHFSLINVHWRPSLTSLCQSEEVMQSLKKAEGQRLGTDQPLLLRFAAIIPIVAASLVNPEYQTPTEFHHSFSQAFQRELNIESEELLTSERTIKVLDLDVSDNLIKYVNTGYTLMLGRLFGVIKLDLGLESFMANVAKAVRAEAPLFNIQKPALQSTRGGPSMPKYFKSATAAVLIYNSAFRLYETFQRTMPKKVLPNGERAKDQAEAKKLRKETKAEKRKAAKIAAKRQSNTDLSNEGILGASSGSEDLGHADTKRGTKRRRWGSHSKGRITKTNEGSEAPSD